MQVWVFYLELTFSDFEILPILCTDYSFFHLSASAAFLPEWVMNRNGNFHTEDATESRYSAQVSTRPLHFMKLSKLAILCYCRI